MSVFNEVENNSLNDKLRKTLGCTLALYSALTLSSMAGMNIGFFLMFFVLILYVSLQKITAKKNNLDIEQNDTNLLNPEFKTYQKSALFIFTACLLSLTIAKINPLEYAGHAPDITLHGYQKIWYLICPYIIFLAYQQSRVNLKLVLKFWWCTTLILLPMAIIQFFTGWPLAQPIPTNPGFFHAILLLGHHLSVASILIFPTYTALSISLGSLSRREKLPVFETLTALSGLIILFLSYARTAWISLLVGFVILFLHYFVKKMSRLKIVSISSLALIILFALSQTPLLKTRIENGMGIHERIELWKANIDFFKHRPLTGIGWLKTQEMSEFYFKSINPEHYKDYFWGHAHSNFFEMLGGTGLIGLLAFFIWTFFTFKFSYQLSNDFKNNDSDKKSYYYSDLTFGLFVALTLLHINGLTNVTFWEGKVMHAQMFAVGLLFILKYKLKKYDPI